ncbi:MAG: hypothetical protein WCI73_08740 [Phycisphaerae bacterium]
MIRCRLFVLAVLVFSTLVLAGQPGEKAKGPSFESEKFSLIWGKLKTTSDVNLGEEPKSKYSLALEGSLAVPDDLDVAAVAKQFQIMSMTDAAGAAVLFRQPVTWSTSQRYNAIHDGVGQVELPRLELPLDATRIGSIKFGTDVVIAEERVTAVVPAVVMEDFKEIGHDISIRITNLQMSVGRELTVNLNFKRPEVTGAFIEKIFAVDPDGKDLGGGRWTQGDPLGTTGAWIAKFKLLGEQRHQSFRFDIVTKSKMHKLSFEVKGIFARAPSASMGAPVSVP